MASPSEAGLFDRTLRSVKQMWQDIAGRRSVLALEGGSPRFGDKDSQALSDHIQGCLEATGGEVSARARAAELGQLYLSFDQAGRRTFLQILAQEFGNDPEAVEQAIDAYHDAKDDQEAREKAESALRNALNPPRIRLLTQFNALPQGVKFLVDLRADLLSWMAEAETDRAALAGLDRDLKQLLESWFDIGFLDLERISWHSPAALLEKLITYEAVHAITSWRDLRNRLDSDRRCYGFFHPRMPTEPLIFVEVALVTGIASHVQTLLDETAPVMDPKQANTAIFYSISNTQMGLRGISLGNFLIKRVVEDLKRDFPNLRVFSTLSPIPGFRKWLLKTLAEGEAGVLSDSQRRALAEALVQLPDSEEVLGDGEEGMEPPSAFQGDRLTKGAFRRLLEADLWPQHDSLAEALKGPLMRLCRQYLLEAKSAMSGGPGGETGGGASKPRDPVARFHLGNGARIEQLNWQGDISAKGLRESFGIMVNYLYDLDNIEANHERFAKDGVIAVSPKVAAKD